VRLSCVKHTDPTSKKVFYQNLATNATAWTLPAGAVLAKAKAAAPEAKVKPAKPAVAVAPKAEVRVAVSIAPVQVEYVERAGLRAFLRPG
jgi:hypothetical protein